MCSRRMQSITCAVAAAVVGLFAWRVLHRPTVTAVAHVPKARPGQEPPAPQAQQVDEPTAPRARQELDAAASALPGFLREDPLPPLSELTDLVPDRASAEALVAVPVHPWQVQRVAAIRKETIEQTVDHLANFDDTVLAASSLSAVTPGYANAAFLNVVVTRLARVRRLLEAAQAQRERVVPLLLARLREALDAWPRVCRQTHEAVARAGGLVVEEPDPYERHVYGALCATYVLAEIGYHPCLPLLARSYAMDSSPVPRGTTLYAMHRLMVSYPLAELSPEARQAREDYLAEAGQCMSPPRAVTVTTWRAKYDESDPRLAIFVRARATLLRREPTQILVVYPHRFADGTPISDGNGFASERAGRLFRKLERFVALAKRGTEPKP